MDPYEKSVRQLESSPLPVLVRLDILSASIKECVRSAIYRHSWIFGTCRAVKPQLMA